MTTMDIPTNPDTRPLPDGWHQHYDIQRKSWYYVQISVMPPKVSYTHPAAPAPAVISATRSSKSSSGMSFKPSLSELPSPPASGGNLSAAQQLYANSVLKSMPNATAPSIPAPELRQMPSPPPATGLPGNIPTPPPSTSPRVFPSFPTPSPYGDRDSPSQQLPTSNSELYGNAVQPGSRSSSARPQSAQGLVSGSIVSHQPMNGGGNFELAAPPHTAPHRSQTFQAPAPPPTEHSLHHRSSTFSAGYLNQRPLHTAPALVTTARPPSQIYANTLNAHSNSTAAPIIPSIASPSFTSIGGNFTSPSLSNAYPSPISLQTSPTPLSPTGGYPFPQGMQSQSQLNASGQRTNQQAMQDMGKAFKQLGKAAMKGTIKVAKATAALSTRMPAGTMVNIGNAVMNGDVVSALTSSFAGLSTADIGIDPSQLQAVLQGQPGADYQAIINALVVRQQQQASLLQQQQLQQLQLSPGTPLSPQQPQVNYTTLIAELQRIQMVANAKQQQQAQTQQQLLTQHQQAALGRIQQGQQQQAQQNALAQMQHVQQVQQQPQQAAFAQIQQQQQQHALSQILAQQMGSQPAAQAHPPVYQPQPQTAAPSQGGLPQYSIQPQTTGQTNHLQNPGQQQQYMQQQTGQTQSGHQQQTGVPQYSIQPQQTGQSTTGVDAQQQAFAQQQQAFAQQQQQQAQQQAQMQADFGAQMQQQQQQQAQIQADIDAQVQQQQAQMQAALDAQMQQQSIQQQQMQMQQAQMQAQMQASLPPNYTGFQAPQQSQSTFDPSSLYTQALSGGTDPSGGSSGLGALLTGFSSALSDNGTSSFSDSLSSGFSGTDSSSDAYADAQMEMQQAQMQTDILAQALETQESGLF